jgi:hypothetical protein
MGREFWPMAIGSIPGFSLQKDLDRGSRIEERARQIVALWAPFTTMRPTGSLLRCGS